MLSIVIQLVVGTLFGHIYDIRIFMAAGHQVAAGQNPYLPQDLSLVFDNPAFAGITTVGYPPPWPLMLGAIYSLAFAGSQQLLIYNAAIKLPLILANIALAYLVAACLRRLGADAARARAAWMFILLNPFLIYASAAWGQFDSIVALLGLASLLLLDAGRTGTSAALLALAIAFKPTAMPLALLALFHYPSRQAGRRWHYFAILLLSILVFAVLPFFVLGWDPSPILENWNAHFVVGGGLSPFAALELLQDTYRLSGSWWLLGLLWIPALAIAGFALRRGITGLRHLLRSATAVSLVFLLTRAWLSEPNIILVLPLVLILAAIGDLHRLTLHALWILPLLFGIANVSAPQLLFPSMPHMMDAWLRWMEEFRTARLVAKVIIAVPWQIVGWSIVVRCLQPSAAATSDAAT